LTRTCIWRLLLEWMDGGRPAPGVAGLGRMQRGGCRRVKRAGPQ
jgi:hypothetical protein